MADNYYKEALALHEKLAGKISVKSKMRPDTKEKLSILYTPGVAGPCLKIADDKELAYTYTMKGNYIAVVTDGTAVLGLGDIGPEAAMPVMEGKCVLFNEFAGINAIPLCIDTKDPAEIIRFVQQAGPSFGGINLEDISAPRCFAIEQQLRATMDIPVFHDDQHGTAIVVLSGVINALRLTGRSVESVKAVINGAGAAGISIARLLHQYGIKHITLCDIHGAIHKDAEGINQSQREALAFTNPDNETGILAEVIKGKDLFIGVSKGNLVTKDMVKSMAPEAIVFAMANPIPEILPNDAVEAGATVVGSGRSDFPNQVNNVLVFPGIFRGALDCRAKDISEAMKLAAASAIAAVAAEDGLTKEYILPDAFDRRVTLYVAAAVAVAATKEGIAQIPLTYDEELEKATSFLPKK